MNKILLLVLIVTLSHVVLAEETKIEVKSNSEFFDALGSNRTIKLTNDEFIFPDRIDVKNFTNLSITAENLTKILVENRKSTVIAFINCDSLYIDNLYIGHEESAKPGCFDENGTVMFKECNNVSIKNTTFFGCGRVGFKMYDCSKFSFENITVKECTEALFGIMNSEHISFLNSEFKDTYKEYYFENNFIHGQNSLIQIDNTQNLQFNSCIFKDNIQLQGHFITGNNLTKEIKFSDCTFQYNGVNEFSSIELDLENIIFLSNGFNNEANNITINYKGREIDIIYAATHLSTVELKQLVQNGADVNMYSRDSYSKKTPLFYAIRCNKINNAEFLINNGANIYQKIFDPKEEYGNQGAIFFDILRYSNIEILDLLKDKKIDYNILDSDHNTPLFHACTRGDIESVKFYISKGAKINIFNRFGNTPLHMAVSRPDFEISKYLIDNGANVNAVKSKGKSPLHSAVFNIVGSVYFHEKDETQVLEVVKLLIENGADIDHKAQYVFHSKIKYYTPIQRALENSLTNVAYFLYKSGAQTSKEDEAKIEKFLQSLEADE